MANDLKKKIEEMVQKLEEQGWTCSKKGRHWKCVSPQKKVVFLPFTPSEYRSVANARALLRRNGATL